MKHERKEQEGCWRGQKLSYVLQKLSYVLLFQVSSQLTKWDQQGMKPKPNLGQLPRTKEIRSRTRERCPKMRTGIKRRSKEVYIYLCIKTWRRMKE